MKHEINLVWPKIDVIGLLQCSTVTLAMGYAILHNETANWNLIGLLQCSMVTLAMDYAIYYIIEQQYWNLIGLLQCSRVTLAMD